jgi:hypothetical protein
LKIFRYNKDIRLTQQQRLDVLFFQPMFPLKMRWILFRGISRRKSISGKSIRRGSIIEAKETIDRGMPFLPPLATREPKPGQQ